MAELLLHTHDEKKGILCQATSQTETRASWISHLAATARHLTEAEIAQLEAQGNTTSDGSWRNLLVPATKEFDAGLIRGCRFQGPVVLGQLRRARLKFHDLELDCGLYNSYLDRVVLEDDVCVRNVAYLVNYHIKSRVILFNISEMSCTCHSKFGNGWLKAGEDESVRVTVSVGNENDGRAILPFEGILPADGYLWSRYREDTQLMERFLELTEAGNNREEATHGLVEEDAVVKNTILVKDAKIGSHAYIKGALKLKNITVCSSREEPSQIGEGVELVNGIMGYGSKVFYQAVAVRFIIGRNCQLKYGGRLLNSFLGDNSTVSCCELLNNLIFPFHEQHHNTSFLIATTILGQSNIAAAATIGSNHNSRSPDGEILAGRGFWPGLASDFKHNSRFASFCLVAKGSYQQELCVTYPFSLVSLGSVTQEVRIVPAYWFLYNMFAIARNNSKFKKRDKRVVKEQHIETNPLAPDSIQEVLVALERLVELTARTLRLKNLQDAKDFLHQNPDSDLVLQDPQVQKKYGGRIYKGAQGYKEYRKIVKYFAVQSLMGYCHGLGHQSLTLQLLHQIQELPLYTQWDNVGGQIIPSQQVQQLFRRIKEREITSWEQVHRFYDQCQESYTLWKARYSLHLLEWLYSRELHQFDQAIFQDIHDDVLIVSNYMYENSRSSRQKDFEDYFRSITYRNQQEQEAVIGTLEDTGFLQELEVETAQFNQKLERLLSPLMGSGKQAGRL